MDWASFAYFRNWADMVGGKCGFTRTGFLRVCRPAYGDQLRANIIMHQQIGIELLVTPDDMARLEPSSAVDDFEVAAP
ncbi:MAG: hypothetical protein IPM76_27840 [Chloroflexi bacterium]|nr:hypothetical protein [Chloroflexota bacterium]